MAIHKLMKVIHNHHSRNGPLLFAQDSIANVRLNSWNLMIVYSVFMKEPAVRDIEGGAFLVGKTAKDWSGHLVTALDNKKMAKCDWI